MSFNHSTSQGPLNIWTEHSNCQIHSRVDSKTFIALLIPNIFLIFFMKLFFYAYKSWGHDPIWYFSCLCRKFSELRALLFLSSTQTSQNLKFIQKCPCLSSLKNKFQWTQKIFWPHIREVLIWTFWDYKSLWSKKPTPIQPQGVIGAPPTMYFQKMQILGVFCPFLQRSLHEPDISTVLFIYLHTPVKSYVVKWP